jgi:hypothetical protein
VIGLLGNGSLVGWGSNTYGVLGRNPTTNPFSTQPVIIDGPSPFRSVAVGAQHVVACAEDGGTYVWGRNTTFELGAAADAIQAATFRWMPTRVSTGALSNPNYRCEIPLAGWNATIIIVDRAGTYPACTGVYFGYNYRNSLPYSGDRYDDDLFFAYPTEDPLICSSTSSFNTSIPYSIQEIAYRGQYGFSIFTERAVTSLSPMSVSSWGPSVLGETLDGFFFSGFGVTTPPLRGATYTGLLDHFLADRFERGVKNIFVGCNSFLLVTSDKNAYIWGTDTNSDVLLANPAGPSLLENFIESPIRLDPLGLLSLASDADSLQGYVVDVKAFVPDPSQSWETMLILSSSLSPLNFPFFRVPDVEFAESWYVDFYKLEIVGEWWSYSPFPKKTFYLPLYLKPRSDATNELPALTKIHSWATGSRHVVVLADCGSQSSAYRCLLVAGDPQNTYSAMGYDANFVADSAIENLVRLFSNDDSVPPENRISEAAISLVAAGPTSTFVVVNGNELWWWGQFVIDYQMFPVRFPGSVSSGAQILQVSVGHQDNGFLVDSLGALFVFGYNTPNGAEQLLCANLPAVGYVSTLFKIPSPEKFVGVSAGGSLTIAIASSPSSGSQIYACGRADYAGLGPAPNATYDGFLTSFSRIETNFSAVSVSVGEGHAVIIDDGSNVYWYGSIATAAG